MLTGQHNTPLCALSMVLPCPAVPHPLISGSSDAAQQVDTRARRTHHNDTNDKEEERKREHAKVCFTSAATGLSSSRLGGALDQNRFAECLVLRGARTFSTKESNTTSTSSAQISTQMNISDALRALDTSLLRENGVRCVQHRTVVAQPQPVPLPFPDVFSKKLDIYGDSSSYLLGNGDSSEGKVGGHHVASCPVLTRMAGTSSFGPVVAELAGQWTSAAGAAQGRAILDSWGVDRDQSEDVRERLLDLSRAYDEEY
jgi:hypothetical protein